MFVSLKSYHQHFTFFKTVFYFNFSLRNEILSLILILVLNTQKIHPMY